MKRLCITLVVLVICVLSVISCAKPAPTPAPAPAPKPTVTPAPAPSAPQPQYGGTLKIIVRADVQIIGTPSEGPGGAPHRLVEPAYDFLVRYDDNYVFKPRLAESWEIAPDGKSITFRLRKGVKFTDGTPFNAAAVKANLEIYAPNSVRTPSLKKIASYDIIDDYTIRCNLSAFDSTLMIDLGDGPGMMCSPTAMKIQSTSENLAKDHLVGTGPFKLASFQKQQNIKYVKNPDYYQPGKPYLDGIEFYTIVDPVTSLISFKKGEAHVIFGLNITEANDLKAAGNDIVTTDIKPIAMLIPDGLNKDSPYAKKEVRQAVEYAIDRVALAKSLGGEYYDPVTQFAKTGSTFFVQGLQARNYDPKKAKELLKSAGYAEGFKTKIYAGITQDKNMLVAIQTYLKEAGIDAELDLADANRMTDMQNNGWKNGLYVPGFPVIPNIRSLSFRLAGGYHVSMARSADWQAKVDATVAQPDVQKQLTQYKELTQILFDEAMIVPLWTKPDISAVDKKVHDLKWTQGGHPRFYEPQDAWLSK
jgi:peptide/nickel transport system substrate-binding protein